MKYKKLMARQMEVLTSHIYSKSPLYAAFQIVYAHRQLLFKHMLNTSSASDDRRTLL